MANKLFLQPYVLAFLVKDTQVLLSLRNDKASFGAHQYALLGGKIEPGEAPSQALIREVKEEAGLTLAQEDVQCAQVLYFKGPKDMCVAFTFAIRSWEGEPVNAEPHKHDAVKWAELANLPENLLARHRFIIECIRSGISYAEWGL